MFIQSLLKLFKKSPKHNLIWDKIIVGKIVKVEKHPNADKLKICLVDCGEQEYKIVCGGVNVAEGMLTAVALPGTKVYRDGQEMEIKEAAIRGVVSHGMLCGADEIDLLAFYPMKQAREIVDLTQLAVMPGVALGEALKHKK